MFWRCLSQHVSLPLLPQGDGQTRNNDTVTPGHTNCQCAARNVVSNAAHATHNGSSLNWRMDTNLFWEEFHLPHPCTLEGPLTSGNTRSGMKYTKKYKVRRRERKTALLWTSILWSFLKNINWMWPQIALSSREPRLRPCALILFYFPLFYYLFCKGWHVKLCISRMASNFFFYFAALGLTWIKCLFFLLICLRVCVYVLVQVCLVCVVWMHVTWTLPFQDVSYLWIFWICKVTQNRVGGAGQNVSLQALISFILEDHTVLTKVYDLLVFFIVLFFYLYMYGYFFLLN